MKTNRVSPSSSATAPADHCLIAYGIIVSALCVLTVGCGADDAPPSAVVSELQQLLEAQVAQPGVPSAIGRLEIGDEVVFAGAAGTFSAEDTTPVAADTPFRSASVGKLFTAVTVLRLVEQGRLTLDTPIGTILPAALVDRLHVLDGVSRGAQLTIRQLLGHTTGIANIDSDPNFNGAVAQDPTRRWRPEELIEFAIAAGPRFAPGTDQLYSSPNYMLLGLVIEAVTREPFHRVARREVLDRLGMRETFEETSEGQGPRPLAHSYIGDLDVNLASPSFEFADGGFVSTTADLTRFGHALARGQLFDRPETQAAMLEAQGGGSIGLGPWVGEVALTSGRVELAYHPGYWGVLLAVLPEKNITFAFTLNLLRARLPGGWV